jgi:hypothetical protein
MPVRLTRCWSSDYAQLAGNIHHATSHSRPTVVSGQRVLCEHLLDSRPRGEPASTVVDGVDVVEFFGSRVMRALVVAQHTCYTVISMA